MFRDWQVLGATPVASRYCARWAMGIAGKTAFGLLETGLPSRHQLRKGHDHWGSIGGVDKIQTRLAAAAGSYLIALWRGPLAPTAEISVLVMQLWATLSCRAPTARDCQAPNQGAIRIQKVPTSFWYRCLAELALAICGLGERRCLARREQCR